MRASVDAASRLVSLWRCRAERQPFGLAASAGNDFPPVDPRKESARVVGIGNHPSRELDGDEFVRIFCRAAGVFESSSGHSPMNSTVI